MTPQPNWEKTYQRLVQENRVDEQRLRILERQMHRFKIKKYRLHKRILQESEHTEKWKDVLAQLEHEVKSFQAIKHRLTPKKQQEFMGIVKKLPMSFKDRVRLMEVAENARAKPCKERIVERVKPVELHPICDDPKPLKIPCDPKKYSSIDRCSAKLMEDMKTLKAINEKTVSAMADIESLKTTINYLQKGYRSQMKITPFVDHRTLFELSNVPPPEKKATITMKRYLKPTGKQYTHEVLDVRPPYILENVPQLMRGMYDFLDTTKRKSKKFGSRRKR